MSKQVLVNVSYSAPVPVGHRVRVTYLAYQSVFGSSVDRRFPELLDLDTGVEYAPSPAYPETLRGAPIPSKPSSDFRPVECIEGVVKRCRVLCYGGTNQTFKTLIDLALIPAS